MRAGLRLGLGLLGAALMLGSTPALGQDSGQATTNTPASDAIGPRELQNFSIGGTVTRPADPQPAPRTPAPRASPVADRTTATERPAQRTTASADQVRPSRDVPVDRQPAARTPEPLRQTAPASAVTVALPKL